MRIHLILQGNRPRVGSVWRESAPLLALPTGDSAAGAGTLDACSRGAQRCFRADSVSQSPGTPDAERYRLTGRGLKAATTGAEVLSPRVVPWIPRELGRTPVVTGKTAATGWAR